MTPFLPELFDGMFFLHVFVVDNQPISNGQVALIVATLESLFNFIRFDTKFLEKNMRFNQSFHRAVVA